MVLEGQRMGPAGGRSLSQRRNRVAVATISALALVGALLTPTALAAAAERQPGAAPVLTGRTSKLSSRLQVLAQPQARALTGAAQSTAAGLVPSGPGSLMTRSGGKIVVLIRFSDTSSATLDAVAAAGVTNLTLSQTDPLADGTVAPADLAKVAAVPGVAAVTEEITPMVGGNPLGGSPTPTATGPGAGTGAVNCATNPTGILSEGDAQLKANLARTNFSVDGTGVKVGVLSDSFNALGGQAADVSAAELPGAANPCGYTIPVTVQADSGSGEDEGRAMAQIVHDLAPGSSLAFATAFNGVVDFANQIRNLKTNGASVIVDDVTYFGEPMFQDGIIAKAVDDVVAGGAVYYSSAANNTLTIGGHDVTSYETSAFRSTPCPAAVNTFEGVGNATCHNFNQGGTDNGDSITIGTARTVRFALSFNQPQGGVTTDLDFFLVDGGGNILAQSSGSNVSGGDPSEFISYQNTTGAPLAARLIVARYTGPGGGDTASPRFKFVTFPNGDTGAITSFQYNVTTGNDIVGPTVIGHNGAARAATVAAVPYSDSTSIEYYSSHGPLKKCWQPTTATSPPYTPPGAAINPCDTKTVDFAATDGGLNSFFPPGSGPPFRFFGTSAAAPHAAAVGALARAKYPCRTPDEILAAERSTAVPMSYPADTAGAGLVDANAMLGAIAACGTPPGAPTSPVATAGNAQATVTWTAPSSSGSSAIDGYTVTASPGGQTCSWTTGPLTCTVVGLTNGTSYTFTVVAHNASGNGPPSVPSNAVVPKTVPGAPTGVSALPGDTTATVSWTAPASNGGATITSYTVTASPGGATCGWTTGPLTCTVTGLTNGTPYTFTVFAHNAAGNGPASAASSPVTPAAANLFHPLAPVRALDSRPGGGNVGPFSTPWTTGTSRDVPIGGLFGVPSDATAVVLNVTVTNSTGSSFLTLWPAGSSQPTASSLNWTPGRTIPNAVTVKLGSAGKVSVFNLSGNVDVIIDVAGYYQAGAGGDGFTSQTPSRILDSRPGGGNVGPFSTPWTTGTTRKVSVVGGVSGVPSDADAVVLNVTVTGTTGSSFLTLWPSDQPQPTASNLNWTPGVTIPNAVTVKVGTGGLNAGMVSVFNLSGNVDVIIDVAGYYKSGTGLAFHPVAPFRVLDSRPGAGNIGGYTTPWGTGIVRGVQVGNVPGSNVPLGADSVVVNTTVTNTTGSSFLTVWPAGVVQPTASSLNWTPGLTIPNAVTVKLGSGTPSVTGRLSMFNLSGNVDVITDVAGWFG